jgi:hypothetical protein
MWETDSSPTTAEVRASHQMAARACPQVRDQHSAPSKSTIDPAGGGPIVWFTFTLWRSGQAERQ